MEPTRREVVHMLMALGLGSAAVTELTAGAGPAVSASGVHGAFAIERQTVQDDEVERIRRALQRSLDPFQRIRDFEMSDDVSLPIVFRPWKT